MGAVFVSLCSLRSCSGGLQYAEEATDRPLYPTAYLAHGPGSTIDRRCPNKCSDSWCVPGSSVPHDALLCTGVGLWADSFCGCHVLHSSPGHSLTLLLDDSPERPGQNVSVVHLRRGDCFNFFSGHMFGSAMQPLMSPDQCPQLLSLLFVHVCSCSLCCSKEGLCHCLSFPTDAAHRLLIGSVAIRSHLGVVFFNVGCDFFFLSYAFRKMKLSQIVFSALATAMKQRNVWHCAYEKESFMWLPRSFFKLCSLYGSEHPCQALWRHCGVSERK